ncbi:carbohydrate ABC transporter permease [Streptomyces aidingensis]|uniref:Raffinose/stachyose/melibiose transport system permease protein n=1 Tax=Streptomyces aidingensis TaxID=910347 RepID=A0A1I1QX92_9ACTN|nr:sugar ABC transporter permease [Streptomyces aidingensis]SFD26699.1 raffinose/stachyose/melibiose transport system permease protein [Streptomyces aidingensis]
MTATGFSSGRAGGAGRTGPRMRGRDVAAGWLFAAPALIVYAMFVLYPLCVAVQYSLYEWNGIGPATWVGLDNYKNILTEPERLAPIRNAFVLIIFFTVLPVTAGLALASLIKVIQNPVFASAARTMLFLPQIIPLVAAGIGWSWMYAQTGLVNQALDVVGLGSLTRPWLGDFDFALPAVGLIGTWVLTGLCTVLLLTAIGKIDPALYESVRLDGGNWYHEFRAVTLPSVRKEIGVLVTINTIAALASFDIIMTTTGGGPGRETMVPGVEIYRLGFGEREIGLASALGVVLMLLVLAVILPLHRVFQERP